MKKLKLLALPLLAMSLTAALALPANAGAVKISHVQLVGPYCSRTVTLVFSGAQIHYFTCIEYQWPTVEGYLQYWSSGNTTPFSYCVATVRLRDDTIGTTVDNDDHDCLSVVRNNPGTHDDVPLGEDNAQHGHSYHVYGWVNAQWGSEYNVGATANSPEVKVP